jgi:hypothetical protein
MKGRRFPLATYVLFIAALAAVVAQNIWPADQRWLEYVWASLMAVVVTVVYFSNRRPS